MDIKLKITLTIIVLLIGGYQIYKLIKLAAFNSKIKKTMNDIEKLKAGMEADKLQRLEGAEFKPYNWQLLSWNDWIEQWEDLEETTFLSELDFRDLAVDWNFLEKNTPKDDLVGGTFVSNLMTFDILNDDLSETLRGKIRHLFNSLMTDVLYDTVTMELESALEYEETDLSRFFYYLETLRERFPKKESLTLILSVGHLIKHIDTLDNPSTKDHCIEKMKTLCAEDVWDSYQAYIKGRSSGLI